jgi:hypothetical protein
MRRCVRCLTQDSRGGSVHRCVNGDTREFSTFAPMALVAIGTLPLPIIHRSILIRMARADGTRRLRRFDESDTGDLDAIYRATDVWSHQRRASLAPRRPKFEVPKRN